MTRELADLTTSFRRTSRTSVVSFPAISTQEVAFPFRLPIVEKFTLNTTAMVNSGEVFALRKRLYIHEPGTVENVGHSFCIWVADLFIQYFACQFYFEFVK